jgi:hypothetical protein
MFLPSGALWTPLIRIISFLTAACNKIGCSKVFYPAVASGGGINSKICISLYIYIPAPLSRVLLKKQAVAQLVKKFHAFYGTRRSNTHLYILCFIIHFNIILHPRPGLPSGVLLSGCPTKILFQLKYSISTMTKLSGRKIRYVFPDTSCGGRSGDV